MSSHSLSDPANDACNLTEMLEELVLLVQQAQSANQDVIADKARKSLSPMIDMMLMQACGLALDLERAGMAAQKK
jgi:hypothetical protein